MREGWKEVKLGEILEIKHGYGFKGEYFTDEKTEDILVTPGNFHIGGGFKGDKLKFYKGPVNENFVLKENDVVVTMTDLSKMADTIGFSAKIPAKSDQRYLHNQRIGLVSLLDESFDLNFIYWLLRTNSYQRYIAGSAIGATVKHTSPSKIYTAKVIVPENKETQRKIASILSGYDDLIENNLKRIKILEEMAQQTYEEWFVRMRFPGFETAKIDEVTGLPEGWEKVKLGDWINTSSGGTPSKKKEIEFYENGTIPWVRTGELKNFSAKLFPKGTVLLAMYGNTIGEVTYCDFPTATNQACCGFLVKNENEAYFIHQYLLKNKEQVLSFRMGAAQENISQTIIQNMELIKPDEILLMEFGQICKRFYDSIINFLYQNQRLRETRDLLLPRLMMGILEV